jgi:AcrR family transcriptional regulator
MAQHVKPRRPYNATRRREQAAQTRRDIITGAGRLFRERGYAVSMPEIAADAGVVVETVYRMFGTKANLFREVVEALLAGGAARAERPVEERDAIRALIAEPDPVRQVAMYAATQPGIHRRAGPILRALRDAKAGDPVLTRLWAEMEAWRYEGQGRFVRMLAERGVLRFDRALDESRDVVWTLCSLAVYDQLVIDRGWDEGRYEKWLAATLARELLG